MADWIGPPARWGGHHEPARVAASSGRPRLGRRREPGAPAQTGGFVKRIVGVAFAALIAVAVAGGLYAAAPPVILKTTELGHGPALVFLHSLGSERMVWMPTAKKLVAG